MSGEKTNLLPAHTINVPLSAQAGEFVSPWLHWSAAQRTDGFGNCAWRDDIHQLTGAADDSQFMLVYGEKPAGITEDSLIGMKDGFRVFTHPTLNSRSIGYVIRWRVASSAMAAGQWRTPTANWPLDAPAPSSAGVMSWRVHMIWSDCDGTMSELFPDGFSDFSTWVTARDVHPVGTPGVSAPGQQLCWISHYGPEVEVRYLLLADAASLWNSQLDPLVTQTTPTLAVFHPRSDAASNRHTIYLNQPLTIRFSPWGTCTTPSVAVPMGTLTATDLATVGSTAPPRDFNLEFTRCPRVPITYFFRAPAGVAVDNGNGIVGLDSTPGNAQGVGIQLRHNGNPAGFAPVQFNQDGNTTVYAHTPDMGQDSSGGITHTIPLRAAIVRTSAAPVVPGKINAAVLVYIQYP